VTFEKKGRPFERLLLAPIPLELLMLSKTSGAVLFGTANAFVPVVMAAFVADLGGVVWWQVALAAVLVAVSSTFLGLFVAVTVSEVFEAQAFSNFFRSRWSSSAGCSFP
jgi:ABC-2 type transport system permease protein